MRERHPQNADGDFYVENDQCIACGAPEAEADGLMSHDETNGHCFFVRQPASDDEVDSAIRATWASCCRAVRYGGNKRDILVRFAEMDELSLCDSPLEKAPQPTRRTIAKFRFTEVLQQEVSDWPRRVFDYLATYNKRWSGGNQCTDFRRTTNGASFDYVWGRDKEWSIKLTIEQFEEDWLLRLTGNQAAERGLAIHFDKALRQHPLIQELRWFSPDEDMDGVQGRSHPY